MTATTQTADDWLTETLASVVSALYPVRLTDKLQVQIYREYARRLAREITEPQMIWAPIMVKPK